MFWIPFLGAFIGWLLHRAAAILLFRPYQPVRIGPFTLQGLLPARQEALANKIGQLVADQFSLEKVILHLTDPEKIKQIIPMVETHLDSFLRERLPKAMPVLSMFIGDSIIGQIKTHLVAELDSLFPKLIRQYLENAAESTDIQELIASRIKTVSMEQLEKNSRDTLLPLYRRFAWIGAISGAITGGVVWLVLACC